MLSKRQIVQRADTILHLFGRSRADEGTGNARIAEHPGERQLSYALAARLRQLGQFANPRHHILRNRLFPEKPVGIGRPRYLRDGIRGIKILIREQSLGQGGEYNDAHAVFLGVLEQVILDPAVHHVVAGLVNGDRRPVVAFNCLRRLHEECTPVTADPGIEGLALLHDKVEGSQGFLEGRLRVRPVRVKDITNRVRA